MSTALAQVSGLVPTNPHPHEEKTTQVTNLRQVFSLVSFVLIGVNSWTILFSLLLTPYFFSSLCHSYLPSCLRRPRLLQDHPSFLMPYLYLLWLNLL